MALALQNQMMFGARGNAALLQGLGQSQCTYCQLDYSGNHICDCVTTATLVQAGLGSGTGQELLISAAQCDCPQCPYAPYVTGGLQQL